MKYRPVWEFSLPMITTLQRQQVAGYFERLCDDPHVIETEVVEDAAGLSARLTVCFVAGCAAPYDPDLRRLPYLYGKAAPPLPPLAGPTAYDLVLDETGD